jgi:hypothetical protein
MVPEDRNWLVVTTTVLLTLFFCLILSFYIFPNFFHLFATSSYGRMHRVFGIIYLSILCVGMFDLIYQGDRDEKSLIKNAHYYLLYDIILGLTGLGLTVSAASDFKAAHKTIKNPMGIRSGTLHDTATVSYNEMIEHAFYQSINLAQAIFLHMLSKLNVWWHRMIALFFVTAPWLIRSAFPIHSFSANYDNQIIGSSGGWSLIMVLYRIKKYQYLLYKHFLLHGLNISLSIIQRQGDWTSFKATSLQFRMYWIGLNSSYTFEFFLQTLVKRRYMNQKVMLFMNKILIAAATLAAYQILYETSYECLYQHILIACISLYLNFANRGNEVLNVAITSAISIYFIN